jgi:hypothetical protein
MSDHEGTMEGRQKGDDILTKDEHVENLRMQYIQCHEQIRAHTKAFWEVPSLVTAIDGGLVLTAFQFARNLVVRELVLILASILTFTVYVALIKHNFYYLIERETLDNIEKELNLKLIQRQSLPKSNEKYWYDTRNYKYRWFEKWSATRLLKYSLLGIFLLLEVLLIAGLFVPLPT